MLAAAPTRPAPGGKEGRGIVLRGSMPGNGHLPVRTKGEMRKRDGLAMLARRLTASGDPRFGLPATTTILEIVQPPVEKVRRW